MAYEYTYRDGEMVEVNVARAFDQMAAEFYATFGLHLIVNSGVRTEQQQWDLYWNWVNRVPGYHLAAKPQDSFHCEVGPQGPRALDLRDSGNDAGVMTIGTQRNNWIRDNGPRWGFTLSGLTFNPAEGWHNHYTGPIGGSASAGGEFPARERYGHDWVVSSQQKLNALGFNAGPEDGYDGGQTQGAVKGLQGVLGVDQDGIYGPVTNGGADVILAGGNYTSRPVTEIQAKVGASADGVWGPLTSRAVYEWQKANGLTADAQWGPASDAKGFPAPTVPTEPVPEEWNYTDRSTSDIQRAVGMDEKDIDGEHGPKTDKAIRDWQASQGIDADGIWGNTSDGLAFPPAGSIHGVDYSFSRPDPAMMKARGIKLALRYLWNTKYEDGRTNKGIGTVELAALRAQDIQVAFIYEEDGKELREGFNGGVRVAKKAEEFLKGLGLAGYPIYFNVDYDAPKEDMPNILSALDGIASVIGRDRTGLYAGYGPIKAAFDADKIKWGFQTYAWSGGKWDDRAQVQQWSNGQWGDSIDFSRAVKAEFGQNPIKPAPEPEEPEEPEEPTPIPDAAKEAIYDLLESVAHAVKAL
jgi:peptidoglycan hydrolase-like protein with peptidoglycan-binding domain